MADPINAAKRRYWAAKGISGTAAIQKAQRVQKARHDPNAYGPNTGLAPFQLDKDVKAGVGVKFAPQEQQLTQLQSSTPGWYQDYRNQLAALAQKSQGQYSALGSDVAAKQSAAQTGANTAVQDSLRAMGRDAATRGAQVDPSLATTAGTAQLGQSTLANDQQSRLAALGQSEQDYLGNLSVNSVGQEGQTRAKLAQQFLALKGSEGDYANQLRQQEIQQARTYGVELGTLGVSQANAQTTADKAKTDAAAKRAAGRTAKENADTSAGKLAHQQMEDDRRFQLDSQKYGLSKARDNYQKRNSLGPYKPSTPTGQITPLQKQKQAAAQQKTTNTARDQFNRAVGLVKNANKGDKSKVTDVADEATQIAQEFKIPYSLAYGAVQQFKFGGVGPKTQADIKKNYGINLKEFTPKNG